MFISTKDWVNYINKLSKLSDVAGKKMQEYVQKNGFGNTDELIEYAHALVTKYGEGSAELACQMYDAIAEMQNAAVPSAVPADMPSYGETAKAIYGSLKQSPGGNLLESVTQRLVKQSSADTMLQNAKRDGAYFAWVPSGDTCPYCLMMGGIGWQKAGKKTLEGKHAKHIHAHCDCQYIVDFKGNMKISGYNPDKIRKKILKVTGNDEYTTDYAFDVFLNENARKSTAGNRDGLNAVRRMMYEDKATRDKINAQKRELYAAKKPDVMNRGRTIKDESILREVSKSAIIDMKSIDEIKTHFGQFDIEMTGFDKKNLLDVQAVMAGVDDAINLMPETKDFIKVIEYNSHIRDMGQMHENGIMSIGKTGLRDYGTGVHETAHAFDYIKSKGDDLYSESVVEQARKNLQLRKNSREYVNLSNKLTANPDDARKDFEVFAYGIETSLSGIDNKLGNEILRLVRNKDE